MHLRGNHEGMLLMPMSRSPALPNMYDERILDDADSLADKISMWLHNGGLNTLDSSYHGAGEAAHKSLASLKKALQSVHWWKVDRRVCSETLIHHCADWARLSRLRTSAF